VMETSTQEVVLYGWGENRSGELATIGINNCQAPKVIDMPLELQKQPEEKQDKQDKKTKKEVKILETSQVFCGKKISGISTACG